MQKNENHNNVGDVKQKLYSAYQRFMFFFRNKRYLQSLIIFLTTATVLLLIEQTMYLSATVKSILLILILIVSAYVAFIKGQNDHFVSFETFYRQFSRNSNLPELKDALDLQKANSGNSELANAAILQSLSKVDPDTLASTLQN